MNWKSGAAVAVLLVLAVAPAVCSGQAVAGHTGPAQPPAPQNAPPAPTPAATPATNPTEVPTGTAPVPSGTPANPACPGGSCDLPQPQHITIATPAPAPAPWPLQDRIKWATVVLLALVAYIGIWLAISALRKIERQTQAAEAAANAAAETAKAALHFAENQAEAQAHAERPWILVAPEPAYGVPNAFTIVAANRGRSPARIVSVVEEIAVAPDDSQLPPAPAFKSDPDSQREPIILLPGESVGIKSFRREDVSAVCASPDDLRRIEDWDVRIFLYGKIVYHDLVSGKEQAHETSWCFWYIHGRQKSGLVPAGPRSYHQHT